MAPTATFGGRAAGITPLLKPVNIELDWDRGRVVEEASLGSAETPFRELLLGVPDARFLRNQHLKVDQQKKKKQTTHLFLIISVFNDNGRTTP